MSRHPAPASPSLFCHVSHTKHLLLNVIFIFIIIIITHIKYIYYIWGDISRVGGVYVTPPTALETTTSYICKTPF